MSFKLLTGRPVKMLAANHSPSGPDSLFRRGISGSRGRRLQRQTRGLELAAEVETGNSYVTIPEKTPV